jgi:VWFA-related protein
MTRIVFLLVMLLACGLAASERASTQNQASPVLVDITAIDPEGQPAAGLTQDDFEIVASGRPCPITFFAGWDRPLVLVLLFDVTESQTTVVSRSEMKEAVEKWFVNRINPTDSVRVGAFSRSQFLSPTATSNRRAIVEIAKRALDPKEMDTFGPSPLWDALYAGVAALDGADGRRAVVVITDGRATGNRWSPEDVAVRAMSFGASVNIVGEDWDLTIRQDSNTGVRVHPGAGLEWIANMTGGLYLRDREEQRAPGPLLARMLDEIRQRYTLGFQPVDRDGRAHPFEVRVKRPDVKLRYAKGYVASAPK